VGALILRGPAGERKVEVGLVAKGFGATTPIGPDTTPEGRQNNRRVELVRMP